MKIARYMQITTIYGVHVQIGVLSFEDYLSKKKEILNKRGKFVSPIETCSIRKEDVSIIEYFEMEDSGK